MTTQYRICVTVASRTIYTLESSERSKLEALDLPLSMLVICLGERVHSWLTLKLTYRLLNAWSTTRTRWSILEILLSFNGITYRWSPYISHLTDLCRSAKPSHWSLSTTYLLPRKALLNSEEVWTGDIFFFWLWVYDLFFFIVWFIQLTP